MSDAEPTLDQKQLELFFSNKALAKSILRDGNGKEWITGIKDREIRWQQGTMAMCILILHTKIVSLLDLPEEDYFISGDRGSPARSLDNLLNKPGEWAIQMFGERNGFPSIRDYIYRRKTVTRNNTISELSWDTARLPAESIQIHLQGSICADWRKLAEVLKNICEEFSLESGAEHWSELETRYLAVSNEVLAKQAPTVTPEEPPVAAELLESETIAPRADATPPEKTGTRSSRTPGKLSLLLMILFLVTPLIWLFFLHNNKQQVAMDDGLNSITHFFEHINNGDYEEAYALTNDRFHNSMSFDEFVRQFHKRRYEDLRILGNPGNLAEGKSRRTYHIVSTMITEVRLIHELAGIGQLTIAQMDSYINRLRVFKDKMKRIGVSEEQVGSLEKKQVESLELSRYLVDQLGIPDETLATLYPTVLGVESSIRHILTLRQEDSTGNWQVETLTDYQEVLVLPR